MEILLPKRFNRAISVATLAVFVLGLALSYSTWRNLRQQQDSFRAHALVTARSIAAGIEVNLRRELRIPATTSPAEATPLLHRAMARDLLQDYIKRTDARFIGLYNPLGHILFSSHDDPKSIHSLLPTIAWESMGPAGEWSGELNFEGRPILVLGRMSRLTGTAFCQNQDPAQPADNQPPLLLVGVDMTQHLAAFAKYKRTALFQTGYILVVTIVFWILLMGFLQRTDQDQRLRHLESFNARLLDNMPDGLLTLTHDGVISAANPAAQTLLGGGPLAGQSVSELFNSLGLDLKQLPDHDWCTIKTDGKHLEVLQVLLKDTSGQRLILLRDRTELAGLEQALHRNEKLAAIGRVATGVAHEIRNPLSALRGFAQFFSKKLAGQEPEELYAQTMVQEADRLNRVITDLLFLARPRQIQLQKVDLAALFQELRNLLALDLQTAHCQLEIEPDAATVEADRDTLKQALINLIVNSMAALPATGGKVALHSEKAANGAWIRVMDNGQGMTEEERGHALEPFYTNRDHGTGLGLAIVHAIVQEHGGEIEIESTPGQGTTVSLFIPTHRPQAMDKELT